MFFLYIWVVVTLPIEQMVFLHQRGDLVNEEQMILL
jgi:hypothetical protein